MEETRYPAWKEQVDQRIRDASDDLDRLVRHAPHFMMHTRFKYEGIENFWTIPENATPQVWRAKVQSMGQVVKTTEANMSDLHDGIVEFIRVVTNQWALLVEAYEVQGRMLSQLLDKLGMESDQVLNEYADQAFADMKAEEEKSVGKKTTLSFREETGASLPW